MERYTPWSALRELGYWIAAIPMLLPVYFVISQSLKTPDDASESFFRPPLPPYFGNYSEAWNGAGQGTVSFSQALVNSVFTTVIVVALLVIIGAPAGYYLARRGSRLSSGLFGLFALGLIVPVQLGVIPLFVFMVRIGLSGSRLGLILVYLGFLAPLAVFLYTGFFRSLPRAYEEAAQVDGASPVKVFVQIVFPLMTPITGTVAIIAGMFVWRDFFTPLVFVGGTNKVTLPVALYSFVGKYSTQWHLVFASVAIALAPIVVIFVFMQRFIMRGFESALRG